MFWFGLSIGAALGALAAVYAWPKVRELYNGAEAEVKALEQRLKDLKAKIASVNRR